MTKEAADRTFEWTDETLELAARAEIATAALRRSDRFDTPLEFEGEEALLWVISGKTPEALQTVIDERKARLEKIVVGKVPGQPNETKAERARRRYHEDETYRERIKADMRRRRDSDEFRAKERERKRKQRARQA